MKKNNSSPMRQMILDFPSQFKIGIDSVKDINIKGDFENVVVSGMGGSAWPTDVLLSWLPALSNKIFVNRTYNLPQWADKKTLFIFVSYSGNTEETVSSYLEAIRKRFTTVAIASGGKLKELSIKNEGFSPSAENKKPIAFIPAGFPPRLATGYILSALTSVLAKAGIIGDKSGEILKAAEFLEPLKIESKGRKIAGKIFKKIPIIYTPDRFKAIGYVWKVKLNENSKVPAFSNYFSEFNHNEISGWQNPVGRFFVIILRDLNDHPRMLERMKFIRSFLKSKKIESEIIDMEGNSVLSQIFNTVLLGDWASYYLAAGYNIDPLPLEAIDRLKKYLGKRK